MHATSGKVPLRTRRQSGSWSLMLMSRRDSPRLATIWMCLRTAPLSALLAGSSPWTRTQDKAATSGGYYTIAHSFSHSPARSGLCSPPLSSPSLHVRYSIDPQSDPEALFRIASDTGFISTVMELDREEEQWHNITVIATQRGMSDPSARGRHEQQSSTGVIFHPKHRLQLGNTKWGVKMIETE